jgi:hypothetical protein
MVPSAPFVRFAKIPQIISRNNGADDGVDVHPSRRRTSVSLFDHFIGTDD